MVHPALRIINAPKKNKTDVVITSQGVAIGIANGAASKVEKRQGKNR